MVSKKSSHWSILFLISFAFSSLLLFISINQNSKINNLRAQIAYFNNPAWPVSPTPTPTPTATPTPIPTIIAIPSNWETYSNHQFAGFEFRYPPDWTMESDRFDPYLFRLLSPTTLNHKLTDELSEFNDYYDLMIQMITPSALPEYLSLGIKNISEINQKNFPGHFDDNQTINFFGKPAVETYELGMSRYYSIFIDSSGDILRLSFNQSKDELTDLQKQILSSFKFTNDQAP